MGKHFDKLVQSIAPGIENRDVEKVGLLMLGAGTEPKRIETERIRGSLHIGLIGDSSTGKTELANYMVEVLPRSKYTIGDQISIMGVLGGVAQEEVIRKGIRMTKKTITLGQYTLCDGGVPRHG